MRGFSLRPADVDVHLLFAEGISQEFYDSALSEWGSLRPEPLQLSQEELLAEQDEHTIYVLPLPDSGVVTDQPAPNFSHRLHVNDEAMGHERLTVEVTMRMLAALAGQMSLFHAAALGNPQTHDAFILVGPSGQGKTTASRFLGKNFSYLSDETAIVDSSNHLRPYPKPLSVITDSAKPKEQIDPASVGIAAVAPDDFSFVLKHVILLDRRREQPVESPFFERVDMADAVLEISQQTSGLLLTDDGVPRLLEVINACGGALRLVYSEITETLPLFQKLLSGELQIEPVLAETSVIQDGSEPETNHESGTGTSSDVVARIPGNTLYLLGDRALLAQSAKLSEISLFAADVWLTVEKPLTREKLKRALQELYGEIPAEDFQRVLTELIESKIIR